MCTEVVAAVICREERYLLCRRPLDKQHGGLWEFPGGKLQPGEGLQAALKRELTEELAVESAPADTVAARIRVESPAPLLIVFIDTVITGNPEALEHEEIGWFEPAEVLALSLAPADAAFARQRFAQGTSRRTP